MFVSFTAARDIRKGEELSIEITVDRRNLHRLTNQQFSNYCFNNLPAIASEHSLQDLEIVTESHIQSNEL